ncbi:hypothetical protein SLS62_006299 [Diatrype stigma]|uniref:Uncharacterized protein n=1 Tax=Diatrype stigma TaxID=117547 RepID=A0AAN9UQ51_9PEZI
MATGSLPARGEAAGSPSQASANTPPAAPSHPVAPSYLLIPGLPNEISMSVCNLVDKTPEFVHLVFFRQYIVFANADRVNAVIRTHKALRQTPQLYTNTARSMETDGLTNNLEAPEGMSEATNISRSHNRGVKETAGNFKKDQVPDVDLSPFILRAGGKRISICLRPAVDVFILDRLCLNQFPEPWIQCDPEYVGDPEYVDERIGPPLLLASAKALERMSNCVLGLNDAYGVIKHMPCIRLVKRDDDLHRYLDAYRALFGPLVSPDSKVEHWKILVGEFDARLLPSDLEEIKFEWHKDQINQAPDPVSRPVTKEQLDKIKCVAEVFRDWIRGKHRFNARCIRVRDRFLGGPLLQNSGATARWLITHQGQEWLKTKDGQEWIHQGVSRSIDKKPRARRWPYADDAPSWWLATPEGAKWLATDQGRVFLDSELGSAWRHQTREADAWINRPGTLDSAWFQTTKGKEYLAEKLNGGTTLPPMPEFPYPDGRGTYKFVKDPAACFALLQLQDEGCVEFTLRDLVSQCPRQVSFVRFKQTALDALRDQDQKLAEAGDKGEDVERTV